jgi:3-oxoacyl-[acyl-carrier-protein] synthase II
LWQGLRNQESGIRSVTCFDATPFNCHIAAQVDDFRAEDYLDARDARRLDRFTQFSIAAARLSMEDAALKSTDVDPERAAVQMGSALGGISQAERQLVNFLSGGVRSVDPRVAVTTFAGAASCHIAIDMGFTGPNSTNAMSCSSGTIALGEAWRLIREGIADVAISGGVEAPLAPLSFGAFAIIRAMSRRNHDPAQACRPFDRNRDGFVMGEGACVLVLEEEQHARERGARIYAELCGYGTTNDAHHMTAPLPTGEQAARAMTQALNGAGLLPAQIDYVNAHASSTPLNDRSETVAIRTALGERAYEIPVSGTKPYHGHPLGASGAIEAAICCLVMTRGWIPPTLNLDEPDDGCDLDYVANEGRPGKPKAVMSNSFGFGGINASLVLSRLGFESEAGLGV